VIEMLGFKDHVKSVLHIQEKNVWVIQSVIKFLRAGSKKPFLRGYGHRHPLILAFFLRGKAKIYQFLRVCMHRHFDLFFSGFTFY
jgi:hypothetical protein